MQETTTSTELELAKQTKKGIHIFQNFWDGLDWEKIISSVIYKTMLIIIFLIILLIIRKIVIRLIEKSFNNYRKKEVYSESRIRTLETLAKNFFQYFLFFVVVYSVLTIIGIPVGSLIAGAGILGVALGLGAQGFISDVITGFFIIYERQLDVGDHVILDTVEGIVDQVGLRTTQVKSFDGTLNYIPNRQILIVSNLSRENQQVLIDIRVNPDEDIEKVKQIMQQINEKLVNEIPEIKTDPTIIGLIPLPNGTFAVRSIVYALAGSQVIVKSQMTTAYVEALTNAGITIPATPMNLTI
ncbi:mechanosensitive ion channel family protein [Vagococcus carniphilus]|uniref:Mechanosensitive ion channel family protein n=1 Tax=Vagococcus carniphilus TaxID=218144 RepID=A0AAW8U6N5_9ENTE|nr:mechanosensitive ion channel family protein [Vagococcus carniphilus]MDT2831435.1 mechanosensitive ion channel family protein [Vagococcus carniphilus]MDT2832658.1 mechanosensitive ion channel family protein [Vagococcus carniphilus]MDT2840157.1 mechanosensitive ion channel family protein [Vagococcus carniphilus]MDT2849509.1 mechanosensitive ion channel family protein [Vagococcus carniphilus]MDT2855020.1 mechanosensitive ion channel family protein [Vagococcus carniphilus]